MLYKRALSNPSILKIRVPVVQVQQTCIRNMASAPKDAGKPPFPPFTAESARVKVKAAQDVWNTRWVFDHVV
jgi:hypothetical protein